MKIAFLTCLLVVLVTASAPQKKLNKARDDLPRVFEYFTEGGVTSGLDASTPEFKLNGKPLKLISGAIHYFRVHPDLWRDRLRKLRALGANTVELYIPWNLHEPRRDYYDFGSGQLDFSPFLDVEKFIRIAQEEDLLVLIRPGPYICTEWDFGGFPSWLLQDENMLVREYYEPYLDRVEKYFNQLLSRLNNLQFTRGGPIVGVQIENEYGSFDRTSKDYVQFLINVVKANEFDESLLFTSDGAYNGDKGTILDQLFYTANFQSGAAEQFGYVLEMQPNKPLMSMEFWSGWFDHWFEDHNGLDTDSFLTTLEEIIGYQFNGSVNFYMFHCGSSFGYMAGANNGGSLGYQPDISSYDYDAPLSEAGDYTDKYLRAIDIIDKYEHPKLWRPDMPPESRKATYPPARIDAMRSWEYILLQLPASNKIYSTNPIAMETMSINGNSGQSYGYIVHRYRTTNPSNSVLTVGPVKDFGLVLVDGQIQAASLEGEGNDMYWLNSERDIPLVVNSTTRQVNIDVSVENMARVNFGYASAFKQRKGLPSGYGSIKLNDAPLQGFDVFAFEPTGDWIRTLAGFVGTPDASQHRGSPAIFRTTFEIEVPADTFLDMSAWHKGSVFINGFNLGRYWKVGPQQTLYIPAPLLNAGTNTIHVFEQIEPASEIVFTSAPNIGRKVNKIHG